MKSKWQYSKKRTLPHAFHPLNTEKREKKQKTELSSIPKILGLNIVAFNNFFND